MRLTAASNQLSFAPNGGFAFIITAPVPAADRTYTIPGVGSDSDFAMTAGTQTFTGAKTFSIAPILSSLTASGILRLDASKNMVSTALTNGQLLIGSTGAGPVASTITGTTNRVTVTNGAGSITLSLPQDIATTSAPSFTGMTVSGLSPLFLVGTDTKSNLQSISFFTTTGMVQNIVSNIYTVDTPQDLRVNASPSFAGVTLSKLTFSSLVGTDASNKLQSMTLATTTGMVQTVAGSTYTVDTPQSLRVTASPTFASATLSAATNQLALGTTNVVTINSVASSGSYTLAIPDSYQTFSPTAFLTTSCRMAQYVLNFLYSPIFSATYTTTSGV
jgi:hypothetical protein